jgi:hypothetical protein
VEWNNEMVGLRLCELPQGVQEYLEGYIPQFCKPPSKVNFFLGAYEVEDGLLKVAEVLA